MIAKLVVCISVACFIDVLISYGLSLILPADDASVLAVCVGIIGGTIAVLAALQWDARRNY